MKLQIAIIITIEATEDGDPVEDALTAVDEVEVEFGIERKGISMIFL